LITLCLVLLNLSDLSNFLPGITATLCFDISLTFHKFLNDKILKLTYKLYPTSRIANAKKEK